MNPHFPTGYDDILARMSAVDPVAYGRSRNFIRGAVTYLSPYISRGVLSTRQVLQSVLDRGYDPVQIETFVKELAWRDYFQRVWQERDINEDLRVAQQGVLHDQLPQALVEAATGIEGIDTAIRGLYEQGYMHNHCRMYTASVACNIAGAHWTMPARWMYYHLLDGDWASNACSWQWVAGSNSNKKYYANQENINTYTYTNQRDTFLDRRYEDLPTAPCPKIMQETVPFSGLTTLPNSTVDGLDSHLPVFLYNYYNLDPHWHSETNGHRVLLLEPEHFEKYPVSDACIRFMLQLADNIPGIKIHTGSFSSFYQEKRPEKVFYKEHPLNRHYIGIEEPRDWINPQVKGYYPSFFSYWKKVEKQFR